MYFGYSEPISGLVGGSVIGLSAAALLLLNGDILGASGLASSFVIAPRKTLTDPSHQWKLSFTAAFAIFTLLYVKLIDPDALQDDRLGTDPSIPVVSIPGFVIGGFLVGFGTRLGNGCTSGHGICGMARLSIRSFAAVGSFMATGILTATFVPSTDNFLRRGVEKANDNLPTEASAAVGIALAAMALGIALPGLLRTAPSPATDLEKDEHRNNMYKIIPAIVAGILFALGLILSKMAVMSKIFGFLNFYGFSDGTWDATLVFVMGGGVLLSFASYQWVKGHNVFKHSRALECPLSQKDTVGHFNVPTNKVIDLTLIAGEAFFGIGWGLAGLCPGPAMIFAFAGYPCILMCWWPSFFAGSFFGEKLKSYQNKNKTSPSSRQACDDVSLDNTMELNDVVKEGVQAEDCTESYDVEESAVAVCV